jgi:hypothetical protein
MFANEGEGRIAPVRKMREAQATRGLRVAAQGKEAAAQLLPPMSRRLSPGALPRQQAAIHRQAARFKRKERIRRTRYLLAYFASNPCVDCGETDPVVLEFDHLRDKEFNVSQRLEYRNWQKVLEEIEKCDVVCANCHRRRTLTRRGALRVSLGEEGADCDEP